MPFFKMRVIGQSFMECHFDNRGCTGNLKILLTLQYTFRGLSRTNDVARPV